MSFREAFLAACYEYLLIVIPVSIYVLLETLHHDNWKYFFKSPEWSIATIFLSFVATSTLRKEAEQTGKKLSDSFFGSIGILNILIIVIATLNAFCSMNEKTDTINLILFRNLLFFIITIIFFFLIIMSKKNIKK